MIHDEAHPLAGKVVRLKPDRGRVTGPIGDLSSREMKVDDWYDRLVGSSWADQPTNWVNMNYAIRGGIRGLPDDDEVVYGQIGGLSVAVHESEIEEVVRDAKRARSNT